MRVKRYVVDSMPDALQRIKADLGKDAIILNTKNIKTGGFLGLFSKKQIEVIAAVDVKSGPEPSNKPSSPPPSASVDRKAGAVAPLQQPIEKEERDRNMYDLKSVVAKRNAVNQEWSAYPHAPSISKQSSEPTVPSKWMPNDENVDYSKLRKRLVDQEVEEKWAEHVIERMKARYSPSLLQSEQSQVQHAKLVIEEMLLESQGKNSLIGKDTKIVKFFGPTGVGKTTTIAKLAAEGVLKNKRKVGLITTDTYRIGAVDQLRTYANILNIPLEVVFEPSEMAKALENLKSCDLIFVDTAGRNYRNQDYALELSRYFPDPKALDHYIVLSLTAKNRDMIEILENFNHLSLDKVIFTKADETQTYGSILNMICRYNLSLSYLTTGQNVPDDIRIAAPTKVANLILGEDRYA